MPRLCAHLGPARLSAILLCTAAAQLAVPARAAEPAQPIAVLLSNDGVAACPTREQLFADLLARTPKVRAAKPGEPARTFDVRVHRGDRGVVGALRAEDRRAATDVHEVSGETCREVLEALALTIALSLDPDASLAPHPLSPPPAPPPSRPEPPPVASVASVAPVAPVASVAPEPASARFLVAGAGFAVIDPSPVAPLAGGSVFVELDSAAPGVLTPSFRARARFVADPLAHDTPAVRLRLATLGVDVCPVRLGQVQSLWLRPCIAAEPGVLLATGAGLARPRTAVAFWLDFAAAARLGYAVHPRLALEIEGAAVVPVVRPSYVRELPRAEVAQVRPVVVAATFSVVIRFP